MKRTFDKLFLFFFLAMASGGVSRVFGGRGSLHAGASNSTAISSGNSDPLLLAFTMLLTGAALIGSFVKLRHIRTMLLGMVALPVLYLFAACSMMWSEGVTETFRGCIYLFIYLASSAYLAVEFESADLVRRIGSTMVVLGLLSIPGQFLMPANGDLAPGWTGIFPQKNDLGAAMSIGVAALMMSGRRWTLLRGSSLILCSVLLLLSQSFTAVITAAVAVVAVLYSHSGKQVRTLLLLFVACIAMIFVLSTSSLTDTFTSTTGKDLTFTGRTEIWTMVIDKVMERPLLGYGYGAFWTTQADSINQFSVWKPGQAHNGYLDICLNLGGIGLSLVLLLLKDSLRRAKRLRTEYGSVAGLWLQVVVLMLLVRNCAEASFLDLSLTWSMLPIAVLSARRREYLVSGRSTPSRNHLPVLDLVPPVSAVVVP